ncbi:MAG: hypothetical protein V4596_02560 [Bdellovibrionota bacterium]
MLKSLAHSEARDFNYSYASLPKYFVNKADLEEKTQRAYNFLTKYIPDPIDRNLYPIKIELTPLENYLGFVHHTDNENQTIKVHDNMKSAVEYQLVLIHELTHILRNAYQPNEERWIQEGLANLIQTLYAGQWPEGFENQFRNLKFYHLSNDIEDYQIHSQGYLVSYFFMYYLYAHFGRELFIHDIATSSESGSKNIEAATLSYKKRNSSSIEPNFLTFDSIWTHFSFAVLLNDSYLAKYNLFFLDSSFSPTKDLLAELKDKHTSLCAFRRYCFYFQKSGLTIKNYISLSTKSATYQFSLDSQKISEIK